MWFHSVGRPDNCLFFHSESDYSMELRRIKLRAFRMQSKHSTTELQPLENRDYQYVPDTCFLTLDYLQELGVAEDRTLVFSHAKRALYL